ncbi:MAG TPA: serine hydrolase domain-containing protein [Sandaracinaceae bacterium]
MGQTVKAQERRPAIVERVPPPRASEAPAWAAAIFDRDGIRRAWLAGRPDLREASTVTMATPFRWWSVTKIVTATAVLALADRGQLDLEAPVSRYVPWFRPIPSGAPITTLHLLAHTSGLASPSPLRWVHPPERDRRTPEQLVRDTFERHKKLKCAPGERVLYTNLGYLLLGELVRRITRLSFAEHVRRAVLAPAGIASAGFEPRGAVGHEKLRSARSVVMAALFLPRTRRLVAYVRDGWIGLTQFEIEGQAYGGLVGSLDDLVRIGRLHLGDGSIDGVRVLSSELARRMREVHGSGEDGPTGLGLFHLDGGWVGHGGEAGGYRSELRFHPERGVGVAVLANSGSANVAEVAGALARLAR